MNGIDRVARRLHERAGTGSWPPPDADAWRAEARVSVEALAVMLLTEKTGDTA